jgi:mitochondrial import inner membrane translocase subunit TIM44
MAKVLLNKAIHPNIMRPLVNRLPLRQTHSALTRYGRSSPYRRIATLPTKLLEDSPARLYSFPPQSLRLHSPLATNSIYQSRHLSSSPVWRQTPKPKESESPESSSPSATQTPPEHSERPEPKNTTAETKSAEDAKSEAESSESTSSEKSESSESRNKKEGKEKDDTAPPPPHGDKTPWQVFLETLQTEFKASKEWNDSTKALQSGYQEFTQNPALQKAKSAYDEASKTASSTTSAALKQTGKAIGQGAAWAWDTPVAKVVRKGATVAGSGIEKVTRPVRETEAFKSVKNVIDDGSSSRYGGWIEKEERKRRRALREAQATKDGKPLQPLEEDPKYVSV